MSKWQLLQKIATENRIIPQSYLFLFLKPIKHLTICLLHESLINLVPVSPSMLIELLLEHLLLHVVVWLLEPVDLRIELICFCLFLSSRGADVANWVGLIVFFGCQSDRSGRIIHEVDGWWHPMRGLLINGEARCFTLASGRLCLSSTDRGRALENALDPSERLGIIHSCKLVDYGHRLVLSSLVGEIHIGNL